MTNRFVRGASTAGQFGGTETHHHSFVFSLPDHVITLSQLSHSHTFTVDIGEHSVEDLYHSHPLKADTADNFASGGIATEDWAACVGYPEHLPPGLKTTADFVNACEVSPEWGPLYHDSFSGTTDPAGSGPSNTITLTHPSNAGITSDEEHTPEYVTLIFIERIDNSA
jgi:hypothetical protein